MAQPEAFDDADDLELPNGESADQETCALFASLLRAELSGVRPRAVEGAITTVPASKRLQLLLCLGDALRDDDLVRWIEADSQRRARAIAIASAVVPPDPAAAHNAVSTACARAFRDWDRYEYPVIVVPGYTPLDAKVAKRGVDPVAQARLAMASTDLATSTRAARPTTRRWR
jgi:hypothetical protein